MGNRKISSPFKVGLKFVIGLGVCLMLVLGLGVLRFHASRLAYYLESLNKSIQQYSDEEVLLRQELSALVAPIRIYTYCKESLGMQKATRADTMVIKFKTETVASRRNNERNSESESNKNWRTRLSWLFGK